MKVKISLDKNKAKSLLTMAEISLERLNETNKLKYPSNTLEDYYGILHQLMETITFIDGIKFKGEGAHFELIDYIFKKYNFNFSHNVFLQSMRNYRNKISYEGFSVKRSYIEENEVKINEVINKLKEIILKKI